MRRAAGIAFGVGNHVLFAFTVYYLFWFLKGSQPAAPVRSNLLIDFLLTVLFIIPHSVMLLPTVRQQLSRFLPDEFYGTIFCSITCISLLIVFAVWQPNATTLWEFTGFGKLIVQCAFIASWIALFYSL